MMNGKECRATRQEIDESELNQSLSDQARSHVALCESCGDFRAERTSLRELVGSLEPVAAPGDFELRLRARMASEQQGRARQPYIFRLLIGTPAMVAAALVVMLALSLVWFAQRNRGQSPAIAKVPTQDAPSVPLQPALVADKHDAAPGTEGGRPEPDQTTPSRTGVTIRENNSRTGSTLAKSVDYGTAPAERFKQIEQRAGEVSLSAPLKPMVVSMQDDRGGTRRISLPPISFGAQRLVNNGTPVSFSPNSRSW
jgi:hypothetical protein